MNNIPIKVVDASKGFIGEKHSDFLDIQVDYELGTLNHDTISGKCNNLIELGRGIESIVFTKSNDNWISTVRKWVRSQSTNINDCPQIQFLLNNTGNGAAPTIYHIKQITKTSELSDYLIDMEHLIPLEKLTDVQWYLAVSSILDEEFHYDAVPSIETLAHNISCCILKSSSTITISGRQFTFKQHIIECFQNILQILTKYDDAVLDLHEANYMARITKYGVQLVITDPIYSNK